MKYGYIIKQTFVFIYSIVLESLYIFLKYVTKYFFEKYFPIMFFCVHMHIIESRKDPLSLVFMLRLSFTLLKDKKLPTTLFKNALKSLCKMPLPSFCLYVEYFKVNVL